MWLIHKCQNDSWYLASFECYDNDTCKLICNTLLKDCEGNLITAIDLSWDYDDTIFIADSNNNRVHIYNLAGKYQGEISVDKGRFDKPQCIVFDLKSTLLYIGQNSGNVIAYEKIGRKINHRVQCIV